MTAWLWPLVALVAVLAVVRVAWTVDQLHLCEAVVAHCSQDPAGVLRHVAFRGRWWVPVARSDAARVLAANAYLRLGEPEKALSELAAVRRPRIAQADLLRAQILVGRGELAEARDLLATRPPKSFGALLGLEVLAALVAVAEDRPDDLLDRSSSWKRLFPHVTQDLSTSLDLYRAAALVQKGDVVRAHAVLAGTGLNLDRRKWLGATWPKLWDLLRRAEAAT